MKEHLTERSIKATVPEIDRDVLVYDEEVTGFAICVYRSGNPAAGFSRFPEMPRDRFLSADEIKRLAEVQRGERVLNRQETRAYNRGERGGQPNIYVTIQTPSPAAFQASRTQLAADLSRAVQMGFRGR